ncbi:unnamed protein product [Ilex paraguariensis]|uniref:Uncharacterized protein n=1 Tax=Ilex paraguariensis TaxID=185542 RepID=A0ABC8UVS5_9AQUA
MDEQEHDIVVHFNNSIFTINRVDPDRYCCMDMVTDVAEVTNIFMGDSLSKVMIAITVDWLDASGKLVLNDDEQLHEMFYLYRNCKEIPVFVNIEVGSHVRLPPPPNVRIGEKLKVDDNEPNVENDDVDANRHEVDYVNGDEHTGVGVDSDDALNVSYENNDDIINTQLDENNDDGFLDYQSGDEGYVSSTDSKELEAEVDKTHRRSRKRKCNVSDTSRFGVGFNVPNDGNTDWDFCVTIDELAKEHLSKEKVQLRGIRADTQASEGADTQASVRANVNGS